MSATYDIGDAVKLTFTVKDAAGVLTNATVALTITDPDGVATNPAITNASTGSYTASVAPAKAGMWLYRWVATGTVTTAEDGEISVAPNASARVYCSTAEVREHLGDTASKLELGLIERAIRAASRAVDKHCGRRFWKDPTTSTRLYRVDDPWDVWVDDIATKTGLVVATGTDGATFGTTLTTADYILEPRNADADGGAYAWWRIVSPALQLPRHARWSTLSVTARWGWSAVPDDVAEATILKAVSLFKRKDAPFGVAGFGEFGAVRIGRHDPDVVDLLGPYTLLIVA